MLARLKASGWKPGDPQPAIDGIETDYTIESLSIPLAKPLEWAAKPLVTLIRAQWLARFAGKTGLALENSVSKVLGNSYKTMGEVTVPIKNAELLNSLNATSKGNRVKVYEAGLQNGVKTETYFFRNNTTNQVFDVKTKYNYWHQKAFKNLEQ